MIRTLLAPFLRPDRAAAAAADPGELDESTRRLVEELREEGWSWSPLVVHFPQVAGPSEELDSRREFFEDYLRDLPTHIREKYDLGS